MKIIKLVSLTNNFSKRIPKGPAEPLDHELHEAADWFVNVQNGTTSHTRFADLYKAAGSEKWSSIAYMEGIKGQEHGRLNGTERASAKKICFAFSWRIIEWSETITLS